MTKSRHAGIPPFPLCCRLCYVRFLEKKKSDVADTDDIRNDRHLWTLVLSAVPLFCADGYPDGDLVS